MDINLIKLFLPEFLVDHFNFLRSEEKGGVLHLYFEEKNVPPIEFNSRILISKGFHQEITLQDFPLRGKQVYLHIKRRRWTDKTNNEIKNSSIRESVNTPAINLYISHGEIEQYYLNNNSMDNMILR